MRLKKGKGMTECDKQEVLGKIDYEGGFDYFIGGSDFSEHTDPQFRKLLAAYKSAHERLEEFLGEYDEELCGEVEGQIEEGE